MTIKTIVDYVAFNEDGSGVVHLQPVPTLPATRLHYDMAPYEVTALNGVDVEWNVDQIAVADHIVAHVTGRRLSTAEIRFVNRQRFLDAIAEWHKRRREAA